MRINKKVTNDRLSKEALLLLALLSFYENQRSDEIPTLDGSISLMQAKFFDHRRYDLTKAGRYKLGKKLNAIARMDGMTLAHDIIDVDGNVYMGKKA